MALILSNSLTWPTNQYPYCIYSLGAVMYCGVVWCDFDLRSLKTIESLIQNMAGHRCMVVVRDGVVVHDANATSPALPATTTTTTSLSTAMATAARSSGAKAEEGAKKRKAARL